MKSDQLKSIFGIPDDIQKLWVRYIEKAAEEQEAKLANNTAIKLMNSSFWTIKDCLEADGQTLLRIKGFGQSNLEMLKTLLRRIEDSPSLLRKIPNV